MPMERADSRRYGVPAVQEDLGGGLLRITGLLEKPEPEQAPSDYAAIGGYVVTPGIIEELQRITDDWSRHRTGEVYLTDAINTHAADYAVYGQVIDGRWYDTGNPADYLVAQFMAALAHPDYGPILRGLATRHASDPGHGAAAG
jgi:UTP--glucose-1-phosphate uridylyltransferase